MNTINPWLAIPLVLSQLAGIAGFILGIINYREAKHRPKLEDQRKYRAQLRECLFPVKTHLGSVKTALDLDRPLPDELPSSISEAEGKLKELSHVLDGNSMRSRTLFLRHELANVRFSYSNLTRATAKINAKQSPTEAERRRYQSTYMGLTDQVKKASAEVDKIIKLSVEMDDIPKLHWRIWRRRKPGPS